MSRILVLYASGGEGHRSAARALVNAFEQRNVEKVQLEDAFDHGSPFYRQLYTTFYYELSENAPSLWEYAYKLTDKTDEDETQIVNELRIFLDRLGVTELDDLVYSFTPDVIVCTHFLPMHILGHYKQKGRLSPPIYGVVTDYTANAKWVCPEIDTYFAATPKTRDMLIERGATDSRIRVTGIPIQPALTLPKESAELRRTYALSQEPIITLIGSALNVKRVYQMVTEFQKSDMRGTLLVVAGRNEELLEAISDIESTPQLEIRKLGFVDYLDDLIVASDLVVTKSGGLIVSEILARHTPMVIVDPIPGQEHWNADYLVSVGAGVQVRLGEMVPMVVKNLLNEPDRLDMMRQKAKAVARPDAAFTIADAVLGTLAKEHPSLVV